MRSLSVDRRTASRQPTSPGSPVLGALPATTKRPRPACLKVVAHTLALSLGLLTLATSQSSVRRLVAATEGEPVTDAIWRRPDRDGMNCLFLQLRALGYSGRYAEYAKMVNRGAKLDRLSRLADAAGALGYKLVPARLKLGDLETLGTAVTGYFEREHEGTGYFGLIVEVDRDIAIVIQGGAASAEVLPRDRFRREWSGYALVPARKSQWNLSVRRIVSLFMAGCAFVAVLGGVTRMR